MEQCVYRVLLRPQERLMVMPTLSYVPVGDTPIDPSDFEASVDMETWVGARIEDGQPFWVVADPGYPGPDDNSNPDLTDFTVTASRTRLLIRYVGNYSTEITDDIEIVRVP